MKTREIEQIVRQPRISKYAKAWGPMTYSLANNGPDGKLRALVGTERWKTGTLKRWRMGLRDFAKRHTPAGVRLSLRICAKNGLVFTWKPKQKRGEHGN